MQTAQKSKMAKYEPIPSEAEQCGKALLDAAFEVHTILGAFNVPHLKQGIRRVVL